MGGGCAASTAQGAAPLGTPLGGYRPLEPRLGAIAPCLRLS